MKTLLTIILSSLLTLSAFAASTNIGGTIGASYIYLLPFSTNDIPNQGLLEHDRLALTCPRANVGPRIDLSVIGTPNVSGFVWYTGDTFILSTNLFVSGTISAATNIIWQTNLVYATNSTYATNDQWGNTILGTNGIYADTNLYKLAQSYYPTNESINVGGTNVITDMSIPYADVNWVTNMYMGRCTNLSTTNYQTAVRMLHGGPATGANIGFDSLTTVVGTARFTNYAIITFFWNPATSVTNALCVPLY